MKFVLLVEGATERANAAQFLKGWLDPRLIQRVGIQVVRFNGCAHFAQEVAKKAQMHLKGPRTSEVIGVIGLLDLYGLPFLPQGLNSTKERYDWAVDHFQKKVNHTQFRMFFAVHDFEAWLLAQPELFPKEIAADIEKVSRPEEKNLTEPPAEYLKRLYKAFMRKN
jgi:hypothetical protein